MAGYSLKEISHRLFSNIFSCLRGKRAWHKFRKGTPRLSTAFLVIPSDDYDVAEWAADYLDEMLDARHLYGAIILSDSQSVLDRILTATSKSVKIYRVSSRAIADIMQLASLYRFDENFICVSIDKPIGRNGTRYIGSHGITKKEVFLYGVYGLAPYRISYSKHRMIRKSRWKTLCKQYPSIAIPGILLTRVMVGYFQYIRIVRRYGSDVSIFSTAWHGTGDYYICGMLLSDFLHENEINNYVFLVNSRGSEVKVTQLFDIYRDHVMQIKDIEALSRFNEFMQLDTSLCYRLEPSDQLGYIGEYLKGFKGFNLIDSYIRCGFNFSHKPNGDMPSFECDSGKVLELFSKYDLKRGKTVLLSPYSTCSAQYCPPKVMWEKIAQDLANAGYTVATNCFNAEECIKNTIPLSLSYYEIVPFLDTAGGFVGIRSGLCDIISTSVCKKAVIHLYYSDFWPNGMSKIFVGLKNMGLCCDVTELEYLDNEVEIEKEIQKMFI